MSRDAPRAARLKSKLAHTLLRNIQTSDLLYNNVLTLHKTEHKKSFISFQCIKDTFLFIDNVKTPCNQNDIRWNLNPEIVTIFDNETIIDQHYLYKQNSLDLIFHGMVQEKLPLDQKMFSSDLNSISQLDRLKLFLQKAS